MLWAKAAGAGGTLGENITAVDYVSSNSINRAASSSDFVFTSQNIGVEDPDRILIIGVPAFAFDTRSTEWFSGASLYPTDVSGNLSITRTDNSSASITFAASWN